MFKIFKIKFSLQKWILSALGMLVSNSRDWHKNGYQIFRISKPTLNSFTWQKPTEMHF